MNYDLKKLSAIIGADEDVLADAARIIGYRRVGPLLCFSRQISTAFILEAQHLQRMKTAAQARRLSRQQASHETCSP